MTEIKIDGSFGEGGGQVLRNSLVISALTGKPFFIENIRYNRRVPGLRRQHVGCIELAARMLNADHSEIEVGATELHFTPRVLKPGPVEIDIGVGSLTLLASVFLPMAMMMKEECTLAARGGTDVPFSPTGSYLEHTLAPLISPYFAKLGYSVLDRGYYPKGSGSVVLNTTGNGETEPLLLSAGGRHENTVLYIENSNLPDHVPRRIEKAFAKEILHSGAVCIDSIETVTKEYHTSDRWRIGVSLTSVSRFENGVIACSGCGKKGVRSEDIGRLLAREHLRELRQPCIDSHLADQLLPYLALFGGEISVIEPSRHFLTGLYVIERFLGRSYSVMTEGVKQKYRFHSLC